MTRSLRLILYAVAAVAVVLISGTITHGWSNRSFNKGKAQLLARADTFRVRMLQEQAGRNAADARAALHDSIALHWQAQSDTLAVRQRIHIRANDSLRTQLANLPSGSSASDSNRVLIQLVQSQATMIATLTQRVAAESIAILARESQAREFMAARDSARVALDVLRPEYNRVIAQLAKAEAPCKIWFVTCLSRKASLGVGYIAGVSTKAIVAEVTRGLRPEEPNE